jgi:ESS family glutamate:Na+ symporter
MTVGRANLEVAPVEYTPFVLLTDVGWICALLLVGKLLRAWVPLVQRLMIPSAMTAGLLAVLLGPHGVGWIPFSDQLGTYSGIMITVVFAAIPFSESLGGRMATGTRTMWSYSVGMYVLQWGLAMLFAFTVLALFWALPAGFGLLLPASWAGGFGTAAAVGGVLADDGWETATSLGYTSATMGAVVGIIGGLAFAKWGVTSGRAQVGETFDQVPDEMRRGLIANPAGRVPIGHATSSPSSLEPLVLHVALLAVTAVLGYGISVAVAAVFPSIAVPMFAAAFVVGTLLKLFLRRTGAMRYVDRTTMASVSGASTDLLVAFGIASINPSVVADYAVPLAVLLIFGTIYCVVMFRYLTPAMFTRGWLERGLFTWGWSTASIATGIALLRIVDPKGRSKTVEEFGLAYVAFAPIEIAMVIVAPILVIQGFSWAFIGVCLLAGIGVLAATFLLGWNKVPDEGQESVVRDRTR